MDVMNTKSKAPPDTLQRTGPTHLRGADGCVELKKSNERNQEHSMKKAENRERVHMQVCWNEPQTIIIQVNSILKGKDIIIKDTQLFFDKTIAKLTRLQN
jgi:hypothetical protein